MAVHLQLLKGLIKPLFCFNAVVKNNGYTCCTVVNNLTLLTTELKDLVHNSVLALLYVRTMFFFLKLCMDFAWKERAQR